MKENRFFIILILILIFLTAGFVTGGYIYYETQKNHFVIEAKKQLESIANLKKEEVSNWRSERLGDVGVFYKNSAFSDIVRQYFKKPDDLALRNMVYTWINQQNSTDIDNDGIFLLDKLGNEKMSSSTDSNSVPLSSIIKSKALEAIQSNKIIFVDFYRNEYTQDIFITIIVPILDIENNDDPLGTLVMRINPYAFLYPYIKLWPVPSDTAETLLVRKEGNDAIFLNELRFQENTALNLRISLDRTEIPAVKAVLGQEGNTEGIDYRGQQVFASIGKIPDSPWYIVARIDQAEVLKPLQEKLWTTIILVAVLIIGSFFIIGFIWRRQGVVFYRLKYEAERELNWLQRVVSSSLNEILIFNDATLKFTFINEGACKNLNYTSEELFYKTPLDIEPEFTEESFRLKLKPLLNKESDIIVYETVHKRKDGSTYNAEVHLQHVDRGNNTYVFLAFINDITRRKLAEQDLKRSNIDLERFAYVASHDLQEPLRTMASFTILLEKRYKDKLDSDANDFISFIVDGAKRMQQLINDLLAFSRAGAISKPFENIDMESVLKIAELNLELAIKESKAKITWEPLPVIKADEAQMVQIFQNLIDNAIKFRGKEPPIIHISAKQEESDWIFWVKDNGIGIDPRYFDRIFLIFQRLHNRNKYPGTGMGLAIVKRIVESYGGRVWIESELQKGSTFYFTIPKKR